MKQSKLIWIWLFLICLLPLGGIRYRRYLEDQRELKYLQPANAVSDAKRALNRGDARFLGVYGLGLDIPGVPDNVQALSHDTQKCRPIDGTGDDGRISGEAMMRVTEYAKRYNTYILHSP